MKHEVQEVQIRKQGGRQAVNSGFPPAGGKANWSSPDKQANVISQSQIPPYQPPGSSNKLNFQTEKSDKQLLHEVREKIISRGARGINGIKRIFKIMDDDNSKALDKQEFTKAMRDYRITQDQEEVNKIFRIFDRDGNGEINYDEFLRTIVGKMNDGRRNIVTVAFKRFDADGNGQINIEDLKGRYNAKNHPDVKMGKKTEEDVLYEFLDTFEQHYSLSVSIQHFFIYLET
jgi:Ca2+-binding EF-hand superfamily protein